MLKSERLHAADPLHEGCALTITIDRRQHTISTPPDGGTSTTTVGAK